MSMVGRQPCAGDDVNKPTSARVRGSNYNHAGHEPQPNNFPSKECSTRHHSSGDTARACVRTNLDLLQQHLLCPTWLMALVCEGTDGREHDVGRSGHQLWYDLHQGVYCYFEQGSGHSPYGSSIVCGTLNLLCCCAADRVVTPARYGAGLFSVE